MSGEKLFDTNYQWPDDFMLDGMKYWQIGDEGIVFHASDYKLLTKLPENSIDLIFTDPEYGETKLACYYTLAEHGVRPLKNHGILITEVPHRHHAILEIFHKTGKPQGLKFRWPLRFNYARGPQPRMAMGVVVTGKPLLCYVKGTWKIPGYIRDSVDMYEADAIKKPDHPWQKSIKGYVYYIEKHTKPGDVVLDPYVGSGTTAFACRELGRRYIVSDENSVYINELIKRLRGEV